MKSENSEFQFDVAVIGAGPAGLMAAVSASESGLRTILIEKNRSPGKKLLMTGNGRCNFTHYELNLQKLVGSYGDNGSFLYSPFSAFGVQDTIDFFEESGVKSDIEPGSRVFPRSNRAEDILNALTGRLKKTGCKIITNSPVKELKVKNAKILSVLPEDGGEIFADRFILCTGGKSYPATGSTGDGYHWAKETGHTIIPPSPALSPLKTGENWVKNLQGLSLTNVGIKLIQGGKEFFSAIGDIIFTHFGISGPLILNISKYAGEMQKKGEVKIGIDLKPGMNREELTHYLKNLFQKNPNKTLGSLMKELFPNRLAVEIINRLLSGSEADSPGAPETASNDNSVSRATHSSSSGSRSTSTGSSDLRAGGNMGSKGPLPLARKSSSSNVSKTNKSRREINPQKAIKQNHPGNPLHNKKINQLTRRERTALAEIIKSLKFTLTGICGFNHAMITSGGIHLAEVDPKTMRSKIIKNLSFAGEILNLDGPTGGYNLQICWSTGFVAGKEGMR